MNIFDVVIILCIALVGVIGLKRGIIKEAVVLIGTILVICVAFWLKDPLAAFLCKHLPFFHLRLCSIYKLDVLLQHNLHIQQNLLNI